MITRNRDLVWVLDPDETGMRVRVRCRALRFSTGFCVGYTAISVLSNRGRLAPLRIGFSWDATIASYTLNPLFRAVEPPTAALLDLGKLPGGSSGGVTYTPSRNRQAHMYAVLEKANARSIALKRIFLRCGCVSFVVSP